jgi:protein TonB
MPDVRPSLPFSMLSCHASLAALALSATLVACGPSEREAPASPVASRSASPYATATAASGLPSAPVALPSPTPESIHRVGGDVREPIEIGRVQPQYPESCRNHRSQGVVLLEAVIDTRGRVTNIRDLRPGLCPALIAACRDALSQWRYRPATLHGKPVSVYLTATFNVHPR